MARTKLCDPRMVPMRSQVAPRLHVPGLITLLKLYCSDVGVQ